MSIFIKRVETMEDIALCRNLAAQVWGEPSACSVPQMSVHAKYGGVLLLAFDDLKPVGFLFSFPALYHGEWVLWSHETAVLSDYLHQGIGAQLKRTQQAVAAEIGYEKIAWTFDPLVSRNAYFNLRKLGAVISEYKINAYGADDSDAINQGMETDRFIAVWNARDSALFAPNRESTDSSTGLGETHRVLEFGEDGAPVLLNASTELESAGELGSLDAAKVSGGVKMETAIPLNFEQMLSQQRKHAVAWRLAFRETALQLLKLGFSPTGITVEPRNATYIWTKKGEV